MTFRIISLLFILFAAANAFGQTACSLLFEVLPTKQQWEQRTYEKWDPEGKLDFRVDNPGELESRVVKVNQAIQSGELRGEQLVQRGIVEVRTDEKMKIVSKAGNAHELQYYEYKLPYIGTSLYIPVVKLNPQYHKLIFIVLPGTGSNNSTGKTVTSLAQTLTKISRKTKDVKEYLGDTRNADGGMGEMGFRAYSIVMDPPGNSAFGKGAPDWFSTSEGMLLAMEHARLVIRELISEELPVAFGGRSQGGLQAGAILHRMGYEQGVIGGIGINPSPTDRANLIASVRIHEDMFEGKGDTNLNAVVQSSDQKTEIDPKMWVVYATDTMNYNVFGPTQGVYRILASRYDTSYEQSLYPAWAQSVVASNPNARLEYAPDVLKAGHDLWKKNAASIRRRQDESEADFQKRIDDNEVTRETFHWTASQTVDTLREALKQYQDYLDAN